MAAHAEHAHYSWCRSCVTRHKGRSCATGMAQDTSKPSAANKTKHGRCEWSNESQHVSVKAAHLVGMRADPASPECPETGAPIGLNLEAGLVAGEC